jgi:hypothetical protein
MPVASTSGSQWHCIRFFPEEVQQGKHRLLRNDALRSYHGRSRRGEIALFSTNLLPSGEVLLYFSPAAAEAFGSLTRGFRIRPCPPPEADDVKLVLGNSALAHRLLVSAERSERRPERSDG